MKKQNNKQGRQRQRQPKTPSKNHARYRKRDDAVYREAHRDDLIRHQIRVGHSPEWIAVLNGTAPAIVLPHEEVDMAELKSCRQAVLDMHGKPAPETPYDEEFDQYLTPQQLDALKHARPVIMMAYVERQFDIKLQRENSLLQNRVRDGIEFGLGQCLLYIGRLWSSSIGDATKMTATAATDRAVRLFANAWKPSDEDAKKDEWHIHVMSLQSAGHLHERAEHFVDPDEADELIKSDVSAVRGSVALTDLERQFWHTTAIGLLNCKGHDGPQASAHRQISRSLQTAEPIAPAHLLDFMGVTRKPVTLVDLMALAFFELPDAHRLFPVFHFHFPDFEALAALGALTRNRSVRIDMKTAARFTKILSYPKPSGRATLEETAPKALTPDQFLRHAMARVGQDAWWTQILQSPADNFGVRHVKVGVLMPSTEEGALKLENLARTEPFATLLNLVQIRYRLQVETLPENRIWECPASSDVAILDLSRMLQYCGSDSGAIAQTLVELAAAGLCQQFDHADAQTSNPDEPGYYREMVRVAAASLTAMRVLAPDCCKRRELDLRYYARFLTDREYQAMYIYGEITGYIILASLGHDVSAKVLEVTSRHRQLHAAWTAA